MASCTVVYLLVHVSGSILCCVGRFLGVVAQGCGSGWGFMVCGVLKEFQRSCWGIWCGRRLNGCCLSALRKCKTVLL